MRLPRAIPVVVGLLASAALFAPQSARAQVSCRDQGKYHLRSDPALVAYGPVAEIDLDGGSILAGSLTISVVPRGRANKDWVVCLEGPALAFGPGDKPIDAVQWQVGNGAWQAVSTAPRLVAAGNGRTDFDVQFRVAVDWEDAPGAYAALLTFSVGQQ